MVPYFNKLKVRLCQPSSCLSVHFFYYVLIYRTTATILTRCDLVCKEGLPYLLQVIQAQIIEINNTCICTTLKLCLRNVCKLFLSQSHFQLAFRKCDVCKIDPPPKKNPMHKLYIIFLFCVCVFTGTCNYALFKQISIFNLQRNLF